MVEMIRPTLTQAEEKALLKVVAGFFTYRRQDQIKVLSLLLVENAILTKEVNEHRAVRGFDLLPVYGGPKEL